MSNKQNRLYTKKTLKENLTKHRPHAEIVCNNQTRKFGRRLYNLKSSRNRGAITFWRKGQLLEMARRRRSRLCGLHVIAPDNPHQSSQISINLDKSPELHKTRTQSNK